MGRIEVKNLSKAQIQTREEFHIDQTKLTNGIQELHATAAQYKVNTTQKKPSMLWLVSAKNGEPYFLEMSINELSYLIGEAGYRMYRIPPGA